MKPGKVHLLIFLAAIAFILVENILIAPRYERAIKQHRGIACAVITGTRGGKGVNLLYEFEYKGKKYTGNKSSPKSTWERYQHGAMTVLVVFDTTDPNNNRFLADEDDFRIFAIGNSDTTGIRCQ